MWNNSETLVYEKNSVKILKGFSWRGYYANHAIISCQGQNYHSNKRKKSTEEACKAHFQIYHEGAHKWISQIENYGKHETSLPEIFVENTSNFFKNPNHDERQNVSIKLQS